MNQRHYLADHYVNLGELNHLRVILHQEFFFECHVLEFKRQIVLFVRLAHLLQKLVKAYLGLQISTFISA